MICQNIYSAAYDQLKGKTVTDIVVGISMLAVELDYSRIALSYTLRDNLKSGCSIFPSVQRAVGQPAESIAEWLVTGTDDIQRAIASATISAATRKEYPSAAQTTPFGLSVREGDKVGMVGMIRPVIKQLKPYRPELYIFDKGKCSFHPDEPDLYPVEKQREIIPECDILILSGTTVINRTIDSLVDMASRAREILVLGSSTPMFPEGFRNSKVTVVAGSAWRYEDKKEIFTLVSRAAGMKALSRLMIKQQVRVERN